MNIGLDSQAAAEQTPEVLCMDQRPAGRFAVDGFTDFLQQREDLAADKGQ